MTKITIPATCVEKYSVVDLWGGSRDLELNVNGHVT
jgi:hypothetical protein